MALPHKALLTAKVYLGLSVSPLTTSAHALFHAVPFLQQTDTYSLLG